MVGAGGCGLESRARERGPRRPAGPSRQAEQAQIFARCIIFAVHYFPSDGRAPLLTLWGNTRTRWAHVGRRNAWARLWFGGTAGHRDPRFIFSETHLFERETSEVRKSFVEVTGERRVVQCAQLYRHAGKYDQPGAQTFIDLSKNEPHQRSTIAAGRRVLNISIA